MSMGLAAPLHAYSFPYWLKLIFQCLWVLQTVEKYYILDVYYSLPWRILIYQCLCILQGAEKLIL
jgi:hypothetical protein